MRLDFERRIARWRGTLGRSPWVARRRLVLEPLEARRLLSADQPDYIGAITSVYPPYTTVAEDAGQLGDGAYGDYDVDLWAIDLLSGTSIEVETFPAPGQPSTDTYVRFFDAAGTELAADDDSGSNFLCSKITAPGVLGGRYYVGVSTFSNKFYDPAVPGSGTLGPAGPYVVRFTVDSPPDQAGDVLADAAPLSYQIGTSLTGLDFTELSNSAIGNGPEAPHDVDLYRFSAFRGTVVTVETSDAFGLELDSYLRLFRSDGVELAFDDDSGAGRYSRIESIPIPGTGSYYIGVSGYPNGAYDPQALGGRPDGSSGDYELSVHYAASDDYGDLLADAEDTGLNTPVGGTRVFENSLGNGLHGDTDVDLFRLFAYPGMRLQASTTPIAGGQEVDTVLRVFDSLGTQLAFNDDFGSLYSHIDHTFTDYGYYYVGVSGYPNSLYNPATFDATRVAGALGDYGLSLDLRDIKPPVAEISTPLNDDVVAGDVDVVGTAFDEGIESWTLSYFPIGGSPVPIDSGTFSIVDDLLGIWDTTGIVDGNYFVQLDVDDLSGNSASLLLSLVVDNTSPIAALTSPPPGATVSGHVPIVGTALDANLASWSLAFAPLPGGSFATIASSNAPVVNGVFATWDTDAVAPGNYLLRLTVTDDADHVATDDHQVTVATTPPTLGSNSVVLSSAGVHAPYAVPVGSGEQLRTVPVGAVDQISIAFPEDVVLELADLTLAGDNSYSWTSLQYDPLSFVATWTLSAPLPADEYTLTLHDSVVDLLGTPLDGEWDNPTDLLDPVSSSTSGDGMPGGDFVFRFNVLPGDANRDNAVTGADYTIWADHFDGGQGTGHALFIDGDFNGDGYVTGADYTLWADNFGAHFARSAARREGFVASYPDLGAARASPDRPRETLTKATLHRRHVLAMTEPATLRIPRGLERLPRDAKELPTP